MPRASGSGIKKEVKKAQEANPRPEKQSNQPSCGSSFFDIFEENLEKNVIECEVDQYLCNSDKSINLLEKFENIREIYQRYNTILASSASAERLFSKGKLVFNTKRHSLHDDHFEQQLV